MADLNSMPVEIIDRICEDFRQTYMTHQDRPHPDFKQARNVLSCLSRASRKLHQIVSPCLYAKIQIFAEEALLIPFTRSILQNQDHADLVRDIALEQYLDLERDQVIEDHFASQQPDFFSGEIVGTEGKITGSNEWYAIRTLDLLLGRLRNLENLGVHIHENCYRDDCFTYIRDKHLDDTEFLPRLKEFVLWSWWQIERTSFKLGSLTALLSVTSVQKLRIEYGGDISELDSFPIPSLLELRLNDIYLTEAEVIRLVKLCPNLQLFRYEKSNTCEDDDTTDYVMTSAGMSNALRHLKKRLQTLSLCFVDNGNSNKASMNSFAEFNKLQKLEVEMYALADRIPGNTTATNAHRRWWLDDDIVDDTVALQPWLHKLPRSLEYLHITYTKDFLTPGLSELAKRANEDFPNLRTIIIGRSLGIQALFRDTNIEYFDPNCPGYPGHKEVIPWL